VKPDPKICLLICLIGFPFLLQARDATVRSAEGRSPVKPGEVVYKLKVEFRSAAAGQPATIPALQLVFESLQVETAERLFPDATVPAAKRRSDDPDPVDLSLIYRLRFLADKDPYHAAAAIAASGVTDYAEPVFVHEALYTPNDTQISQQYFLNRIQAFAGWDISRGDTNTVIGIVDTGTDWDHPDIQSNIILNYADPVNGADDDGDGYTDNFRGWDISENDNNPVNGFQEHGSHVSGCAGAVTDNVTGVAGTGFHCRLLPIKVSYDASVATMDHGYEGIVYAADHGCAIINCSWGRRGGPSQYEQDIINYATVNRQALVIASSGNQGIDVEFYPASYPNVLSVAATDSNDAKAGFSVYNYKVDVCAPGDIIFSTYFDNTYSIQSGTSMSAGIVSGCAALVKSQNPAFTPAQVAAKLRATCDDIYSVGTNATYNRKLGKGRINLYRALTDTLTPGIEVSNLVIDDGNDNTYLLGDTLRISALFRNLLHPASALTVTLSSNSPYLSLLSSSFSIGVLNTFDSVSNAGIPFRARILGSAPLNTAIELVMTIADGSYSDFYAFRIMVNIDYLNVTVNDISTSVNSLGRFGYNKSNQTEGLGFTYLDDESLLFAGGLMIGTSVSRVSDAVLGAGTADDDDFTLISLIRKVPSVVASFEATGRFNDAAASTPIPVSVSQYVYAWDNVPHRKYIILKYAIKNSGTATLTGLRAGLFADWDIANYEHNKCSMDAGRKLGYTWSSDTSLYTGIKLLNFTSFNQYAVDNDSSGLGGLNLTDGFTTAEKYTSMSTTRTDAGVFGAGKDVINIVSTGPFTLPTGDSVVVAFALLAGDSLSGLQESADDVQHVYDSLLTAVKEIHSGRRFSVGAVYPNPAAQSTTVVFHTDAFGMVTLELFDVTGRKVMEFLSEKFPAGEHRFVADLSTLNSGVYFLRLTLEDREATARVIRY
jgi:serine protease